MVMHLKSCCCGCSLKTGTVIIAVLGCIGSLGSLIMYIMACYYLSGEAKKEMGIADSNEYMDESLRAGETGAYVVFIILAIISAIHLVTSIVLVFGASSEKPSLVKPWIIYAVMSTVAGAIIYVVYFILCLVAGLVAKAFLMLVMAAVAVTLSVYFILVVNSFHTEILSSNTFSNKV